ncbi:MAG TPA: outer membrane protein assembly factor BamD [Candidatus Polarisedimenticolia bacterium]
MREVLARLRVPAAILAAMVIVALSPACAKKRKEAQAQIPPEQIYQEALHKIAKKHYYTARFLLQKVVPRIAPEDRDLLPRVQLAIAEAYFKDGGLLNYGESLNGFRNFLTYFPDHKQADYAQYMVGMSLFKQVLAPDRDQALTLKAIDEFRKVETVYPDSPHVADARRRIDDCYDQLAEHERMIGRFYQKRRRWLAAIDRYRVVLEKYPRFKSTNLLLFDLGRCQLEAGQREEAEATYGRLWNDDPNGKLGRKAKKILEQHEREQEKQWGKKTGS